jgi:glycyl-radical enzyme activating protein
MNSSLLNGGERGLIFNIQRFSVHDGPGIRTTVFMKGCPLNCLWCSNPESQVIFPNLMVRDINCKGCGACVKACPKGAITLTKEGGRKVNREKCNQCLLCVESCQYNSLNICGKYMVVKEVLDEGLKDKAFYKNSGGGVTISGGECLVQSKFTLKLLKACKGEGLHTALDTTGYAPWKEMESLLPFVDLVLFDIKHLDSKEHKRTTGVGNKLILENLEKASKIASIWLRVPLIAGFNDSTDHIRKIAALGKRIGTQKISFLPYHEGGKSKSGQLGWPYPLPDAKAPSEKHIGKLMKIIGREGLKVSIGI